MAVVKIHTDDLARIRNVVHAALTSQPVPEDAAQCYEHCTLLLGGEAPTGIETPREAPSAPREAPSAPPEDDEPIVMHPTHAFSRQTAHGAPSCECGAIENTKGGVNPCPRQSVTPEAEPAALEGGEGFGPQEDPEGTPPEAQTAAPAPDVGDLL